MADPMAAAVMTVACPVTSGAQDFHSYTAHDKYCSHLNAATLAERNNG